MYHVLSRQLLARSDNIILFSKKFLLWENISSKNEVINDRVYWTDDITENFVTECLIKVQTFLNEYAEKSQLDGWIKFTNKKILMECIYTKTTLSKVSACCRCSMPSWLPVCTGLIARCNCNNHYYYSGLLQVQQTTLVCCKCNRQQRWLYIAITNVDAGPVFVYQTCMLVGTNLQIWLLVRFNC